ncbi:hypothetical protein NCS52_00708500 [Fusarium sp. LHS14.1]|nr:hypothetical protein NCS52_00708500 [Fusarium sp. LHS14.1]
MILGLNSKHFLVHGTGPDDDYHPEDTTSEDDESDSDPSGYEEDFELEAKSPSGLEDEGILIYSCKWSHSRPCALYYPGVSAGLGGQKVCEGSRGPVIDGVGLPFPGATQLIDSYVNLDTKIQGFRPPSDILAQHEFHFLFHDRGILPKARIQQDLAQSGPTHPCGFNHKWDKVTSQEIIPANLRQSQYPATYQFDGPNEAQTSLTQSAVQEVFWVMKDCETIRCLNINARFIKLDKDKSTKHNTHFLLIVNTDEQMSEFAITLPRVTKEGSAVKLFFRGPPPPGSYAPADDEYWDGEPVYLKFNANSGIAKCRVAAISKVFRPILPDLPDTRRRQDSDDDEDDQDEDENSPAVPTLSPDELVMGMVRQLLDGKVIDPSLVTREIDHIIQMNFYLQDFVIGQGLPCVLYCHNDDDDDLANGASRISLSSSCVRRSPLSLPYVDFFSNTDSFLVDTILSKIRPLTRYRFEKYLGTVPLGLISIFGFAGYGKTETLAIVAPSLPFEVLADLRICPNSYRNDQHSPSCDQRGLDVKRVKPPLAGPYQSRIWRLNSNHHKVLAQPCRILEVMPRACQLSLPQDDFKKTFNGMQERLPIEVLWPDEMITSVQERLPIEVLWPDEMITSVYVGISSLTAQPVYITKPKRTGNMAYRDNLAKVDVRMEPPRKTTGSLTILHETCIVTDNLGQLKRLIVDNDRAFEDEPALMERRHTRTSGYWNATVVPIYKQL